MLLTRAHTDRLNNVEIGSPLGAVTTATATSLDPEAHHPRMQHSTTPAQEAAAITCIFDSYACSRPQVIGQFCEGSAIV